jgi:nucleotide-binding universal stress UspA family protein
MTPSSEIGSTMAIKDILLALVTYPTPSHISSVDDAVSIARAFDARITAVACEAKFNVPGSLIADALIDISAIAATESGKSISNAKALFDAFGKAAKLAGVEYETFSEKCFTSEIPGRLTEYARLRDLTILPVPAGDDFDQWYAESIIFGSGRPTLLLPREWKNRLPFETAVVAWDFSRPAARAVTDALPFLEKARKVRVLIVSNDKDVDMKQSGAELAKNLARHRVEAVLDVVDGAGRDIGATIRSYAASYDADLLVMGGYGHSRIKEFILGGATRSILSKTTLPVLMSH